MSKPWTWILLASAATACIRIPVSESAEGTLSAQFDATGACEGTSEAGGATVVKSIETVGGVETCRIDVSWAGDLADLGGVRQQIEEKSGVDLSVLSVEVESLVLEVTRLSLVDAAGSPVSAPTATFDTDLNVAGVDAFDLEGASLDALLSSPVPVTVTDALLTAVQTALNEGGTLTGESNSTLRVPTADLPALQAVPNPLDIELDVRADIEGSVGQNVL